MTDPQPPRHHDCAFCGLGRHDCALALATSSAQDHNPLLLAPGRRLGKRILCPLRPMDQGPPCPCSLALRVPGLAHTHHASCLNTDSHASPWKPASSEHCPGDSDPSSPTATTTMCLTHARDPGCMVLEVCFPAEPCVWPLGSTCLRDSGQRGKDTGIPSVQGQGTEGEDGPLKQVSVSAPGVQAPEVQGMACPCGYLGTIGALCACLLREALGCGLQPGTTAAGTTVTVPLNLYFADLTFLPVCHYPVLCTYPAAMVGPKEMRTGHRSYGHSLSP